MPQSLSQVLLHIIFSTKNRYPFIDEGIAPELYDYLGGTCLQLGCQPLKVGGHLDHVHISCALSRTLAIMDLLKKVKQESSKWMKTKGSEYVGFYWQDGYAAFSFSLKEASRIVHYIENQKSHHRFMNFQDECRGLFQKYGIEWDERYVWD